MYFNQTKSYSNFVLLRQKIRLNRDLILKYRPLPKLISALVDGHFHLITIDSQSQYKNINDVMNNYSMMVIHNKLN